MILTLILKKKRGKQKLTLLLNNKFFPTIFVVSPIKKAGLLGRKLKFTHV